MSHLIANSDLAATANALPPEKISASAIISAAKSNLPTNVEKVSDPSSPETFIPESSTILTEKKNVFLHRINSPSPPEKNVEFESFSNLILSQTQPTATVPENINSTDFSPDKADIAAGKTPEELKLLTVGINLNKRNVINSVLVRGTEDGFQAVRFDEWLLPYDAVIKALKFDVKPLADGQIELRSSVLVTRIDPRQLRKDPQLGLVFSIKDLQTLFQITAKFDINDYAILLTSANETNSGQQNIGEPPVKLEGLPRVKAPDFSLTTVEQQVNINGNSQSSNESGELSAIGTAFGGSWYLRTEQPDILNTETWKISEAQFSLQRNAADYLVGSQLPFWRSTGSNDYWGFTTIQRRGFTPADADGSEPNSRQRLEAAQVGRTISGRTEPGTLVRLVQGFEESFVAEILVDSSGIYRFDNVNIDNPSFVANYRLLLYPQGRLTEKPEIRSVTFSTVAGQLPSGASALIVSGGFGRDPNSLNTGLLGGFKDFQGGVSQRWGVSQDLTVGVGGIYDETFRGLGEIFYQPGNFPLSVAVSGLSGDRKGRWNIDTDIRFDPTKNISTFFRSDRFSSRFDLNWRLNPNFTLLGQYDSVNGTAGGVQFITSGRNNFSYARVTLDTESRLRWNLAQRLGQLEFNSQGNEIGTLSELSYNLSGSNFFDTGHSLLLGYESRKITDKSDNLTSLGWRYRSEERASDGRNIWEAQLGYATGSQGSGPIAVLQTAAIPGLLLRGRYQGVSVTSGEPSFGIELVSSLNFQRGITPGQRRSDRLRTQGGLLIQPFFDRNNNGRRDVGEEFYTKNPDLLLLLNNKPLKYAYPEVQSDRILARLKPGTYRLELDPAGYPQDWQASTDAYAVDVVAGSFTPVLLPLTKAYTLSGVVTDTAGNAVAGARVEALSDQGQRLFSVTNGAGVYYLERLQQGIYNLQINGESVQNLTLNNNSAGFQELNLKPQDNQVIGSDR